MIYPMEGIDETHRMEIEARSELMATMNRLVLQKGVSVGVINQVALDMIITGYVNYVGDGAYEEMIKRIDGSLPQFRYGLIGFLRETFKGRDVKFIGFKEGMMAGIFEDMK